MPRALALLVILLAAGLFARGQAPAPRQSATPGPDENEALARQAISNLRLLESEVIVYKSLAAFEEGRALGRVSFHVFQSDLQRVSIEVELILAHLPENKSKTDLINALSCYRDGAYWWGRISETRVIHVSEPLPDVSRTEFDVAYRSTVPYTVVINWRNASKYLRRAAETLDWP